MIEKNKLSALSAEFNTMKAVSPLVFLLSLGLTAVAASASTLEESYLRTCNKDPGVPVPLTVVSPSVSSEYNGAVVQLEFVVDAKGKPAEFSIKTTPDDVLATAVVAAVKQWRFQPAEVDGQPVARKVMLPVRIVDPAASGERYAAF
jgi:TonB family protein